MIEQRCLAFENEIQQIIMDQYEVMINIVQTMKRTLDHQHRIVVFGVGYNHQMAEEFVGRLGWIDKIEAVLWSELMVHENNRYKSINECPSYAQVIFEELALVANDVLVLVASEISQLILACIHNAQKNGIKVVLISEDYKFKDIVPYNLISRINKEIHPSIMQCFLAQCCNCLLANQLSEHPKQDQLCLQEYALKVVDIVKNIRRKQKTNLQNAKKMMAQAKKIYIIGAGHSHMTSEMILAYQKDNGIIPILEEELLLFKDLNKSNRIETILDYGIMILDKYQIQKEDLLFVVSNSGKSKMIIECCKEARGRGAKIIAITNINQIPFVTSNHPSGKKLYEMADLVIDNCGYEKDACMKIGDTWRCPTSSYISMFLAQLLSEK